MNILNIKCRRCFGDGWTYKIGKNDRPIGIVDCPDCKGRGYIILIDLRSIKKRKREKK